MNNRTKSLLFIIIIITSALVVLNQYKDRDTVLNEWRKKINSDHYKIGWDLSGNAKWYTYDTTRSSISIASIGFPYSQYTFSLPEIEYDENKEIQDAYFYQWSPDNTALLVKRAFRYCGTKSFIIIERKNGQWVKSEYTPKSTPHTDKCYGYKWSEDGQKIAIYEFVGNIFEDELFKAGDIYPIEIYDRKANLVQRLEYQIPKEDINMFPHGLDIDLYWFENTFFLLKNQYAAPPIQIVQLSEKQPTPISNELEFDGVYKLLGIDPEFKKLLLYQFLYENQYLIVNIEENKIEKQGVIINDRYQAGVLYPEMSSNGDNIAFVIRFASGDRQPHQFHLVTWDWNSFEFTDHGKVQTLQGWDTRKKGFWTIVESDEDNQVMLKLVQP